MLIYKITFFFKTNDAMLNGKNRPYYLLTVDCLIPLNIYFCNNKKV